METPALVLLPGMDGSGALFAPFIAAWAGASEVIVVRYPPRRPLGYAALCDLARAALPMDRPFVIMGESFSGPVAMMLAAERPQGQRALVLCCTFVRDPHPRSRALRALATRLPPRLAPRWLLSAALFGRHATPAHRAALASAIGEVSGATFAMRMRAIADVDVRDALARVEVPVLCLRAAEDRLVPASAGDAITALVPAARVVDVAAPHALLQAAPEVAVVALRRFLAGCT